jgi:hypothetical protein
VLHSGLPDFKILQLLSVWDVLEIEIEIMYKITVLLFSLLNLLDDDLLLSLLSSLDMLLILLA